MPLRSGARGVFVLHDGQRKAQRAHPDTPFCPTDRDGPRVVFIVDEAQVLKPSILETIRGLWDRGDQARIIMSGSPAFGCALVGNDTFMRKGGTQRVAGFQPLRSRVTHDVRLPRPNRTEHDAFAQPELIRQFWREVTRGACGGEDELNTWLRRSFKVSSLRFLTAEAARKAITGLKAMKARAA